MRNNCTAETIGANEVQPFSYPIQIMKAYPVVSISRLWSKDSTKKNIFFFRENIIWNGCSMKNIKMEHKHKLDALISLLEFCRVFEFLLETEMRVMPHPTLQHQPTKHNKIVANWLKPEIQLFCFKIDYSRSSRIFLIPITLFMTKEQNLESPSHSSSYRVLPQQQQQTKTPLNIVPKIKKCWKSKFSFCTKTLINPNVSIFGKKIVGSNPNVWIQILMWALTSKKVVESNHNVSILWQQ